MRAESCEPEATEELVVFLQPQRCHFLAKLRNALSIRFDFCLPVTNKQAYDRSKHRRTFKGHRQIEVQHNMNTSENNRQSVRLGIYNIPLMA
jgi:hypothetical protein